MPWFAAAAFAMSAMSSMQSYNAAKTQQIAQERWQEYQNGMTHIADAQNQNAITQNTTMAIQASAREAVGNQSAAIDAEGSARVAAAAAGVRGGSADATIFNVERAAAKVEYERQTALTDKFLGFDTQRRQSALSAKMQEDHSYIPKPSAMSMLLGIGQAAISAYQSTQPKKVEYVPVQSGKTG